MKVLIISQELWTSKSNGGNVLTNLFEGFDAEFAQIYCSPGLPNNNICKKYYQITDLYLLKNLISKNNKSGFIFNYEEFPNNRKQEGEQNNSGSSIYTFFRKHHWFIFDFFREFLWKLSRWNSKELNDFIADFNPDIIFAPCYGNIYMNNITLYIAKKTNVNVISYISDDHYSLKQFRFSPLYWIHRFSLRKSLRKVFKVYSLVYTMTEEQMNELKIALNANMKILRKGGDFKLIKEEKHIYNPIKLVYAGNLLYGRIDTLYALIEKIRKINEDGVRFVINLYTNTPITNEIKEKLHDNKNSFIHQAVNQVELQNIYEKSDIVLHIESFRLKYKLLTRLSFSTKIVDCLSSGCAVMCISWKEHSGFIYLHKEDAAICIDNIDDIDKVLKNIDKNCILNYRERAINCLVRNHNIYDIRTGLYLDFKKYLKNIN